MKRIIIILLICGISITANAFELITRNYLEIVYNGENKRYLDWKAQTVSIDFKLVDTSITKSIIDNVLIGQLNMQLQSNPNMWISFKSSTKQGDGYTLNLFFQSNYTSCNNRYFTIKTHNGAGYYIYQANNYTPPMPAPYYILNSGIRKLKTYDNKTTISLNGSDINEGYTLYIIDYSAHENRRMSGFFMGTGYPLHYENITEPGTYYIEGVRDQTLMEGRVTIENMAHNKSDDNWISKKIFISNKGAYTEDLTYYNGLGLPSQVINIQTTSSDGKNVVTPIYYDDMYRDNARTYLPFVSASESGKAVGDALALQSQYHIGAACRDTQAYSRTSFENSPLSRITATFKAGTAFSNTPANISYATNSASDCLKFQITGNRNNCSLSFQSGMYSPGDLFANTIVDEDGDQSREFKDKLGRIMLTRQYGRNDIFDTYYVYDKWGNLCYVLPPALSDIISTSDIINLNDNQSIMQQHAYVYKYDLLNRCIAKRLPGKDWEYMVYDKGDRLVLSQDGNMRDKDQWIYTIYDKLGRIVRQNIVSSGLSCDNIYSLFSNNYSAPENPLQQVPFSDDSFELVAKLSQSSYGTSIHTTMQQYNQLSAFSSQPLSLYTSMSEEEEEDEDDEQPLLPELPELPELYVTFNSSSSGRVPNYLTVDFPYMQNGIIHPNYFLYADGYMSYYDIPGDYIPRLQNILEQANLIHVYGTSWDWEWSEEEEEVEEEEDVADNEDAGGTVEDEDAEDTESLDNPRLELFTFTPILEFVTDDNLDPRTTGMLVYDKIYIVNDSLMTANPNYIERAYYYDYKGRVIQIVERNHLDCISRVSMKYDFVGNILAQHESHKKNINEPEDVLTKHFIYDHRGRLLQDKTILNGGNPAVVSYGYNELGQLIARTYGTGNNAITDSLKYNIQGWLTEQKNQLFDMELKYYDPVKGTKPSYTGNITEWKWEHKGTGDDANTYAFAYDGLSRLTNSQRYEGASTTPLTSFTEQGLSYDRNGNINTLKRYGQSSLDDDFEYTYSGNQLRSLKNAAENDATYTYGYDANGNCTSDGRTGLGFKYNFLNLINQVEKGGGIKARYHWLSDGTKLGVRAYDETGKATNGYEYLGSLVYQYDADGDLRLESAAFGGGRIMASETTLGMDYTPNYFLTDHLGSTRVVVDGSTNQPSQRNDYYAFGMRWDNPLGQTSDNRWLYTGKEDQTGVNVPLTDYGARMYDSRLGRWSSMDPLAEKYYSHSPYNYCANNPIKFIDPDGRDIWDMDEWGKVKWLEESKKHTMYALGKDGTRTGQSITINDRSIFDGLAKVQYSQPLVDAEGFAYGKADTRFVTTGAGSGGDMANTFQFLAKNTNNEWSLSYGIDGNGVGVFGLRTQGLSFQTTTALSERKDVTIVNNIHSHPAKGLDVGISAENYSMGGDRNNSVRNQVQYGYYIYMGASGNVWQVIKNSSGTQATSHNRGIKTAQQLSKILMGR